MSEDGGHSDDGEDEDEDGDHDGLLVRPVHTGSVDWRPAA